MLEMEDLLRELAEVLVIDIFVHAREDNGRHCGSTLQTRLILVGIADLVPGLQPGAKLPLSET